MKYVYPRIGYLTYCRRKIIRPLLVMLDGSPTPTLWNIFAVFDIPALRSIMQDETLAYSRGIPAGLYACHDELMLFLVVMGYFAIVFFCRRIWRYFWKLVKMF